METAIEKIVDQLLVKTRASKAKWTASLQPNSYQILLSPALIRVGTYISNLGHRYYEFVIQNDNGNVVDRSAYQESSSDGQKLKELYTAAKNAYTGKDKILDSIFAKLGQDEIGEDPTMDLPF